ncbi:MAG: hypothetical protein HC893_00680 [Chloroflexaceae bacterium]|nr:hypothetical protein [Chloroflexaceae bacterium]
MVALITASLTALPQSRRRIAPTTVIIALMGAGIFTLLIIVGVLTWLLLNRDGARVLAVRSTDIIARLQAVGLEVSNPRILEAGDFGPSEPLCLGDSVRFFFALTGRGVHRAPSLSAPVRKKPPKYGSAMLMQRLPIRALFRGHTFVIMC